MENLFTLLYFLSFEVILSAAAVTKGYSVRSLGCFVDRKNDSERVLPDYGYYRPSVTIETCTQECLNFNKNDSQMHYVGLEYGNMCFCGREGSNYNKYGPSSNCSVPCGGNKTQICGGHLAISVYQINPSPCGQPTSPTNGSVILTDNNTALFSCFDGYQLQGSPFIHCNLSTSVWDIPREPNCTKSTLGKCKKLENPLNGTVHQDDKQANFSCDQAHILDGEGVLFCLPTGNWSPEPPDCIPEPYLTTMFGTEFSPTPQINREVFGLPIHIFTSLLLVAAAVLVVAIIILVNLIVKTTTETKRIKKFKTDSTCAEQRSHGQGNNDSYWKSPPDLLKTGKSPDSHL